MKKAKGQTPWFVTTHELKKTQGLWASSACCIIKKKVKDRMPLACEAFNPPKKLKLSSLGSSCFCWKDNQGLNASTCYNTRSRKKPRACKPRLFIKKNNERLNTPKSWTFQPKEKPRAWKPQAFSLLQEESQGHLAPNSWSFQPKLNLGLPSLGSFCSFK